MEKIKHERINCVEGLKGIGACLIAFVWHYQHFMPQYGSPFYKLFAPFYDYGDRVVELFIILSGFGMVLGYERKIEEGTISFGKYMFRRIEKLFPLMWLTLLVTTLLQAVLIYFTGTTFVYQYYDVYHFILNVLGLQNSLFGVQWSFDSPSWCISILIVCYLLFYYVVYTSRRKREFLWIKYVLFGIAGVLILITGADIGILNPLMGRGLSSFFVGALLATIYMNRQRLYSSRIGYLCMAFLLVVSILIWKFGYGITGHLELAVILGITPAFVLSALFVTWLNAFFSIPPFVYLGRISFAIYLWHFPVQCIWRIVDVLGGFEINYSRRIVWILYTVSVLVVASIYELFFARYVNGVWKIFVREGEKTPQ